MGSVLWCPCDHEEDCACVPVPLLTLRAAGDTDEALGGIPLRGAGAVAQPCLPGVLPPQLFISSQE